MILIDRTKPLTAELVREILNQFHTKELPKLKRWGKYYDGLHDILLKKYVDSTKPCNKIITNFCSTITDNYLGYITGVPISYDTDSEAIQDCLRYNDYQEQDKELLRQALIYGRGIELAWIDEEGKVRFNTLETTECIPVYWNTISKDELAMAIRYYPMDTINDMCEWVVEVYTAEQKTVYYANNGLTALRQVSVEPNYFNQVPITVLTLNEDERSIFNGVMGLNDAYNQVLSGEIDDFDTFADAYLVITGVSEFESETLETMRRDRAIVLTNPVDGSGAPQVSYLTKDINDAQIQNILNNIKKNIFLVANCVDFSDDAFGTASGIAMKMKLLGMENEAGVIEKHMTKALQKRIELLCSILAMTGGEEVWRDVNIIFTRNIPVDEAGEINKLNSLRGLVSNRTLLSQLPFIKDVDEELERIKEEQGDMYEFGKLLEKETSED